jgi:hypothetical protein
LNSQPGANGRVGIIGSCSGDEDHAMCTTISRTSEIAGAGKAGRGWLPVTPVTVACDHPAHTGAEHALLLDFTNCDIGTDARIAVELDLVSAKALLGSLERAIDAAEASGLT